MSITTFGNAPLTDLVGRYVVRAHSFLRHPDAENYARMDAGFRELRLAQRLHWPALKPAVDALGVAACDVVNTLYTGPKPGGWEAVGDPGNYLSVHEHAISRVLEALAPPVPA